MPFNQNGRHAMLLGGLTNAVARVSIHSDIPDDTGSDEILNARQAVTWGAPSSSTGSNSVQIQHTVPTGETVVAFGFWSDVDTGGTFYGWTPLNGSVVGYGSVDSAGVTSNTIQSAAHGLVNTTQIFVRAVIGETLPGGLTQNTLYFIVNATTNTFQVAATSGGSALDIAGQGELFFQSCVPQSFPSGGTLTTVIGGLDLTIQPQ